MRIMREASAGRRPMRSVALATSILLGFASGWTCAQDPRDDSAVKVRRAVTDPAAVKEGTYFRFHEKALSHQVPEKLDSQLADNLAILKRRSSDELAREYISAYDGASSDELTVTYVRQTAGSDDSGLETALRRTRNVLQMPDGHRLALPVLNSYALHLWLMRSTAHARLERTSAPNVAGSYFAEVSGDCPISAGRLTLAQRDFRLEGTREGRLLLSGALGDTTAAFIATETRYSSTTIAQEQIAGVAVPDRPSEVYHAALGESQLRLVGTVSRVCSIALRPLP